MPSDNLRIQLDHDLQHRRASPEEDNPELIGIGTATKTT
jgi:hypothetical protein